MPDLDAPRPPGPPCGACGQPAVVQWTRRPTDAELDTLRAGLPQAEAEAITAATVTVAARSCPLHAITPALAARTHAATCAAPALAQGCTCTPEPLTLDPFGEDTPTLPVGW